MYVVTVAEMRAAEEAAIAAGISEAELQASAGAAVAACAQHLAPAGILVVLAGVGKNGRDGWVAACDLVRAGRAVRLYLAPRHAVTDEEIATFVAAGGALALHSGEESVTGLRVWLADASLAVDGLLGIGARGAPRAPIADIAAIVNGVRGERGGGLRLLAIDVPSGVDADSGAAEGECVQADATVVLGAVKQGLLRFPGSALAGVLYRGEIGLPANVLEAQPVATVDRAGVRAEVPPRVLSGHKGTFGRVVVAAGSPDYYGAAYLAGAAQRLRSAGLRRGAPAAGRTRGLAAGGDVRRPAPRRSRCRRCRGRRARGRQPGRHPGLARRPGAWAERRRRRVRGAAAGRA
jgi:ADP-dependent NAD(P)H-hydrate dehydratase / NAD(P)H-hydrate epimerase